MCKPKVEEIGKSICNEISSGLKALVISKEYVGLTECEEEMEWKVGEVLINVFDGYDNKGEGK